MFAVYVISQSCAKVAKALVIFLSELVIRLIKVCSLYHEQHQWHLYCQTFSFLMNHIYYICIKSVSHFQLYYMNHNMFTDCDVDKILARRCLARRRIVASHDINFTIS